MNTPEEFAMRCKTATDSLPEARYREHLERLHRDMLEALAALSAENAALKADRDSWIEQCSQRVEDWHKEHLMVNALKADAERYRWLRDRDHWPAVFDSHNAPEPVRGPELDYAIDAAHGIKETP